MKTVWANRHYTHGDHVVFSTLANPSEFFSGDWHRVCVNSENMDALNFLQSRAYCGLHTVEQNTLNKIIQQSEI